MSSTKSGEELRSFARTLSAAFLLFSLVFLWKGFLIVCLCSSLFAIFLISLSLFAPLYLGPIEWLWMAFADCLSAVMTRLILIFVFYVVFSSLALLMLVLRKRPLGLSASYDVDSYWRPVDKKGPSSRPFSPY